MGGERVQYSTTKQVSSYLRIIFAISKTPILGTYFSVGYATNEIIILPFFIPCCKFKLKKKVDMVYVYRLYVLIFMYFNITGL